MGSITKQYSTNASAQLDQTIFDKSLLVGLKANKLNKEQADLNVQQSEETIIYNIAKSYYQIKVYREQLNLLKANMTHYSEQVNIATLQVQKGVLLQKELDKVTVDRNNTISKIKVAESNILLAENQLKFDMGFPFDEKLKTDTTAYSTEQQKISEGNQTIENNFKAENRTDYKLSTVSAKIDDISAQKIKAGIYPKISAYAKYGIVGYGDNPGQSFSETTKFSAIGLKVSFPILDFYKRNAQYKQARYQSQNALEQIKINEGKYRLEYENAKNKVVQEQANIKMDHNNLQLAQSVLATTDLQYKKGVTDMTDWLNAQNALKESQINYLNSLYNLLMSKIEMEKSAGTIKNYYSFLQ